MIDSVEIPTSIMGLSTITSSKKVPSNDCNNDRQPEIAIWSPKPEILVSLDAIDSVKIPTTTVSFSTMTSSKKVPLVIASATENRIYVGSTEIALIGSLWFRGRAEYLLSGTSQSSALWPTHM